MPLALATTALSLLLVGCALGWPSRGPVPNSPGTGPNSTGGLTWIVSTAAMQHIKDSDPSGKIVFKAFANPNTYLLLGAQQRGPAGMSKAILTRSFTSYNQLASALLGGHVSPNVKAVLYDNESWILTPPEEQQDPARYDALGAQAAHQRNVSFIAAPAMDLVTVLGARPGERRSDAYLRIGLARTAAANADVIA